jgi:toluene monooxygenase system protein A
MALLQRAEWYDLARTTNWKPSYVSEDQLFPPELSDPYKIPMEKWATYDEPYKVTYRDYVSVQRDKDAGVYAVNTAAARTRFMEDADQRWLSVLKFHFGGATLGECISQWSEGRMVRFGKAPGMRNMATFGLLDEIRHGQLQLFMAHENIQRDMQFDWGHKALHTDEWGALMARSVFDDIFAGRDALTTSIQLTSAFETGFTNMQFLGLAAEAAEAGDTSFANLISSIQTDESRHAQIGAPVLKIMIENGLKKEAQKIIDVAFWRTWRFFGVIGGPSTDYYMPLKSRSSSFKEFTHEWIVRQFERQLLDMGLDTPWYWNHFIDELDFFGHAMHMGIWMWRPTVWFNPPAGITPDERDWLEEKYPGWNDTWGKMWDVVIDNAVAGRKDRTVMGCLPVVCNMSQLPIVKDARKRHWDWNKMILDYKGRRYYFQSEVDRWVFQTDPERYGEMESIVDRMATGKVQPPSLEGALAYTGLGPREAGREAHDLAWADVYRRPQSKKAA